MKKNICLSIIFVLAFFTIVSEIMPTEKVCAAGTTPQTVTEAEVTARIKELVEKFDIRDKNGNGELCLDLRTGVGVPYAVKYNPVTKVNEICNKEHPRMYNGKLDLAYACPSCNCHGAHVLSSEQFKEKFGYNVDVGLLPYQYFPNGNYGGNGWQCFAFSNFVAWYIAKEDQNTDIQNGKVGIGELSIQDGKLYLNGSRIYIGDIIRTDTKYNHSCVFIGCPNNNTVRVLDANFVTDVRGVGTIAIHDIALSDFFKVAVSRPKNYNPEMIDNYRFEETASESKSEEEIIANIKTSLKELPDEGDEVWKTIGDDLLNYGIDIASAGVDILDSGGISSLLKGIFSYKETIKVLLNADTINNIKDKRIADALWEIMKKYPEAKDIPDVVLEYAGVLITEAYSGSGELQKELIKTTITQSPRIVMYVLTLGVSETNPVIQIALKTFEASADTFWDFGEAVSGLVMLPDTILEQVNRIYNDWNNNHKLKLEALTIAAIKDCGNGNTELFDKYVNNKPKSTASEDLRKSIKEYDKWYYFLFNSKGRKELKKLIAQIDDIAIFDYEAYYWETRALIEEATKSQKTTDRQSEWIISESDYKLVTDWTTNVLTASGKNEKVITKTLEKTHYRGVNYLWAPTEYGYLREAGHAPEGYTFNTYVYETNKWTGTTQGKYSDGKGVTNYKYNLQVSEWMDEMLPEYSNGRYLGKYWNYEEENYTVTYYQLWRADS